MSLPLPNVTASRPPEWFRAERMLPSARLLEVILASGQDFCAWRRRAEMAFVHGGRLSLRFL